MWFIIVVIALLLIQAPKLGIWVFIAYLIYSQATKKNQSASTASSSQLSTGDLADLVLLRLELQHLAAHKPIDIEQFNQIIEEIDDLSATYLADLNALPDNALWLQRKEIAWQTLKRYSNLSLAHPPWFEEIKPSASHNAFIFESETSTTAPEPTPVIAESHITTSQEHLEPAVFNIDEQEPLPNLVIQTNPANSEAERTDVTWQAQEPSRLERAFKTLSGWHTLAVPFLIQNIGWFIGVFCFIAGSMFLVAYSSGYIKNLIAFFAFFIFTLALLFAGYQLRLKRPELLTSSYVIFILSVLLIPITHITATQLLLSSTGLGLQLFSALLGLVELGVFYFAVQLVTGLINRSLQQQLPKFLLALTASQLLQGVLLVLPFWQFLALSHVLIFALLSLSIYRFANDWLHALFVDKNNSAYFAAGILVYAALVAFVFISHGNNIVLPEGYYGLFLILLCGLLFFIDSQLKQWLTEHTYLSRFSFFVYGLSVLGLCLSAQQTLINIISLVLAIGLYGFVLCRYLTLTPLTILLVCVCWLYGLLVLRHLPATWHLCASVPLLWILQRAAHWALQKRQSAYLALIVYRVLYALLVILTSWSLMQSVASFSAVLTSITATLLSYQALKSAPQQLFNKVAPDDIQVFSTAQQNLLHSTWFYLLPLLWIVTVFYTPSLWGLNENLQFALGLLVLSAVWSYRGVTAFLTAKTNSPRYSIEQYLNSALLTLALVLLPLLGLSHAERGLVLLIAGGLMCWLSYQLLIRWLFCLVLIVWGITAALLKLTYYPVPSNGLVTLLLGLGLWYWLWRVERQATLAWLQLRRDLMAQRLLLLPVCRLFGVYQIPSTLVLFREVSYKPLEGTMWLLWLLSLKSVTIYLGFLPLSPAIIAAFFLAVTLSKLMIIRYVWIRLLSLPIVLGMAGILLLLHWLAWQVNSLLLVAVLLAPLLWQLSIVQLAQPWLVRVSNSLNPRFLEQSELILRVTHHTLFVIALSSALLQLKLATTDGHSWVLCFTLLSTSGFLWLSDRHYPEVTVRYWMLGFLLLASIELVSLSLHSFSLLGFSSDVYASLLLVVFALVITLITLKNQRYGLVASHVAVFAAVFALVLQFNQVVILANAVITPLACLVLLLVALSLFVANFAMKISFAALLSLGSLLLAILWSAHYLLYGSQPFYLWLSLVKTPMDLWFLLGGLSCLYSIRFAFWQEVYRQPLQVISISAFIWTLLEALILFFFQRDLVLSGLFLVLLATAFNLATNTKWRSFFSVLLATLAIFNVFLLYLTNDSLQIAVVLWAVVLWWLTGKIKVIETAMFPYWGFALVALSPLVVNQIPSTNSIGFYSLALASYSVLMLRYSQLRFFSWLAALLGNGAFFAFFYGTEDIYLYLLIWLNVQLLFCHVWQRYGERLAQRGHWQQSDLLTPIKLISLVCLWAYTLQLSVLFFESWQYEFNANLFVSLVICVLLGLTFLNVLFLTFSRFTLHGLIYSVFLSVFQVYQQGLSQIFQLPIFLISWSVLLLLGYQFFSKRYLVIKKPLIDWLHGSMALATLALLRYSASELPELLLALLVITALTAYLGCLIAPIWWVVAGIELLLLLHGWWFLWLDYSDFFALMPWYALQLLLFRAVLMVLFKRFQSSIAEQHHQLYQNGWQAVSGLIILSVIELFIHGVWFVDAVLSQTSHGLFPPLDSLIALSAGFMLTAIAVRRLWQTPDAIAWYMVLLWLSALAVYSRLVYVGTIPIGLWDTAVLIVIAYGLFLLQHFYSSKPLLHGALLMPMLALCTVPLQLATPTTSIALIVSAVFYAWVRQKTHYKIPLYLALLAANASVYLWIPDIVDNSQLLQIYVIPAAISVLWLLQLHKQELKPSVLMNCRLIAMSSIYACATADVFLLSDLRVFVLAIVLSIIGIALGIALKIRAFLYAGLAFLLLNVIGQLVHFYPEQRLGKAIVLMALGTVIIGLMIWFNIKRVVILKRIQSIQTDMQNWE